MKAIEFSESDWSRIVLALATTHRLYENEVTKDRLYMRDMVKQVERICNRICDEANLDPTYKIDLGE